MMPTRAQIVAETLDGAIRAHERFRALDHASVIAAAEVMIEALGRTGRVLAFGNGGSAADAQHFAAELVGRFQRERRGLAALALSTDTSVLTSIANDYGYDRIFGRQIEALGQSGDVAMAISTSGNSPNIRQAVETAQRMGLITIALTGSDGGVIGRLAQIHINVPESSTARVQEVHRTVIHAVCDLIEQAFGD
jgi:D-sedoheptulose 7-phosphate isomerase